MNAKTPMTLDEVLAVMDAVAQFGHTPRETALHDEEIDQARATIAALQSAQAEEVAGLREERDALLLLAGNQHNLLVANAVKLPDGYTLAVAAECFVAEYVARRERAEQAEARLARVEADAARYVWLREHRADRFARNNENEPCILLPFNVDYLSAEETDAAIDAALAAAVAPVEVEVGVGVGE